MKNYKKGILALAILSTMSLMAADDKTIYVTTFADEDGENLDKCSLREAITAASTMKEYGGCQPGDTKNSLDTIQLEAGEYKLTKELRPNSELVINGVKPIDYTKPDVLTNQYPALTALKTTISGQGTVRIFNTTNDNKPALTLNNLILKDGSSQNDAMNNVGGAIYAGGATSLSHVSVLNSTAKTGGAIYLNNSTSSLTTSYSNFEKNNAEQGSVVAMSCSDNLTYTGRTLSIGYSSFIENGSANSSSVFSLCGEPSATFTANTIAKNTANPTTGSIIQFSSKTPLASVALGAGSGLALLSNTIVQNNAWSTLLYGLTGKKNLSHNILAYNTGKSCRYADGDVAAVETAQVTLIKNALALSSTTQNGQCEVPDISVKDNVNPSVDLSNTAFSTVLSDIQPATEYTGFMQMYFPRNLNSDQDLVDVGYSGCSTTEQRGLARVSAENSNGVNNVANSCDIGSTEVLRLTANNLAVSNTSVVLQLQKYQKNIDDLNTDINGTIVDENIKPYYRYLVDQYTNLIKYIKSDQKYRTIFVDPFSTNIPEELLLSNGGRQIKQLNADNYDVKVEALGVGMLNDSEIFDPSNPKDPNLHCEWNAGMKQILMWRTDDSITQTGDSEFCRYTLTLKSDTSKTSSAYIIGKFVNIAPSTKDATIKIEHGTDQKVTVDLLQYADDDGDGLVNSTTLPNEPNKSAFYINEKGEQLPIRLASTIDPLLVTAERSGPCPGVDKKYTCYGGKMTIQLKNTLDVFSYKLGYYVYDADGKISVKNDPTSKIETDAGTITLENSASTKNSTRESGGGSFGWLSLVGLIGLAGYRRHRMNKKV